MAKVKVKFFYLQQVSSVESVMKGFDWVFPGSLGPVLVKQ